MAHLSASYSLTMRLELRDKPGMFARVAAAIGRARATLGSVDLVSAQNGVKIRDVVILASDEAHAQKVVAAVRKVSDARVVHVSDRTFLVHLGGKIEVVPRVPVKTRDDLSMIYTPGVARVAQVLAKDPQQAWNLTIKKNTVAVVTDGTAVLGLGDIGPTAALPIMEGKAILFKVFGGLNAFPICLDTKNTREIVEIVCRLAPVFGGINLEDISAPRCFEIEEALRRGLDIPVMHDDQHGTAVVALAALVNASKIVAKPLKDLRVV